MTTPAQKTVFIVDDDEAVRSSLSLLMKSIDLNCESFVSANAFLEADVFSKDACLLLDVRMPGMSGIELQAELARRGSKLPIIFMTGHGDIPMAVEAMKKGAADFLAKPFRDQELIDRINHVLAQSASENQQSVEDGEIQQRFTSLSPREAEVFHCVVDGQASKVIAADLGISMRTVEVHRARVMSKMGAKSLAQLVQLSMRCSAK